MPVTQALSSKGNVKKFTNQDLPFSPQQPVMSSYYATSTAAQTVINLSFSVDTINQTDQFFLFVDGKKLRLGASNDYTFTSIGSDGRSSQVTLTQALAINLNIQAYQLGLKSELEFGTDARFTQLYEAQGNGFQGFVSTSLILTATTATGTPAAGTFHSSIIGRSSMLDISQNLRANMAIDRFMVERISRVDGENATTGEYVWAPVNDTENKIRFVGAWVNDNAGNAGPSVSAGANTTDFMEVTFYGTGLNMLISNNGTTYDFRASVDGGAEGANLQSAVMANTISSRGVQVNATIAVASGLTLGVHTIKIRANSAGSGFRINGFDMLNESGLVKVNPGVGYIQGKKYTTAAQSSFAYNAAATGTRGGRTVVYQNGDGTIGRAWQAVNPASATHASADHTNEEIARTYNWREFGGGRTDDFSRLTTALIAYYTLEDGTTTMDGTNITAAFSNNVDTFFPPGTGDYFAITFVGTGLDLVRHETNTGAIDAYNVTIDGVSAGAMDTTAVTGRNAIKKIVSGLPYGTHVVTFQRAAVTAGPGFSTWIVYQPKKPAIPAGAIELADYNVMADFVANTTAGQFTIAQGVIRKNMAQRETTYVQGTGGTSDWAINTPSYRATTDRLNAYTEITFFGTGVEIRQQAQSNQSNNLQISFNGLAATTANFPSLVSSTYGTGVTFAAGVGDFLDAASTSGAGIRISGLPLGKYTMRMNNGTAGQFTRAEWVDIITPIHSHRTNAPASYQNALTSGSQGISDTRKFTPVKDNTSNTKAWAIANGIASGPTTTSSTFIPMPDMSVSIKTNGGPIRIEYEADINNSSASGGVQVQIYVDGFPQGPAVSLTQQTAGATQLYSSVFKLSVSAAVHKIDLFWLALTTGTIQATGTRRVLLVEET